MPVLEKKLAKKLQEYSDISKTLKEKQEEEKNIEEIILNKDTYVELQGVINMYNEEVNAFRNEKKIEIKEMKGIKDTLKEEIVGEVSDKYAAPFRCTLPNIGSILISWKEVDYFNEDSVDKLELINKLIELNALDCIKIDEEKYLELSKTEELPGIYKKEESKITIRG